jgi:hypothetical protein
MHSPFAPLIAITQRGIPFTASAGQASVRPNAPLPRRFPHLPPSLPDLPRVVLP